MYHPKLGRFLQTDPLGYKDGMNWYAYVGNDPINGVDPDGTTGIPFALTPLDKGIGPTGQQDLSPAQQTQGAAIVAGALVGGLALNVSKAAALATISKITTQRTLSRIEYKTKPGAKLPDIKTDVTKNEFEKNLSKNGFSSSTSKDGKVNIFTKEETTYTTRNFSKSTKGPTAEVFVKDEPVSKIRLGENK